MVQLTEIRELSYFSPRKIKTIFVKNFLTMKKVNLLLSAVAIAALTFTSCKNCYDCFTDEEMEFLEEAGEDAEFCLDEAEDDDYSRADFKADIEEFEEDADCNCK